jgi:hypothetical protein
VRGQISGETYEAWNRETGGRKLPERVNPKRQPNPRVAASGDRIWRIVMTSKTLRRIGGAIGMAAVATASYAAGVAQGKPVNMPMSAIKWQPYAPGSPLQVATLWGNREKGPEYAMLLRLPAGFEAGMHAHTADYHAVSVQGTWVHSNQGDPKQYEMPPGSYVMQPGKVLHNDSCKGATDCIILVHQHGPGDFIPGK